VSVQFKRVLVPYDFSRAADAALAAGAALTTGRAGELTVVHAMAPVYTFTGLAGEGGMPSWIPPKELVEETRQRMENLVTRVAKTHRVGSVRCRVFIGEPLQVILQAARRADAIVMATLGRTGLSHLVIGSVAEKVVRHSPVPVLTIGPKAVRRLAPARKAGRVKRRRRA
jgi:nucleotide-binding universal stress UspA family protein